MALHSMTGFGRGASDSTRARVEVEVRSVNHRFLDTICRLPAAYQEFEQDVARAVRERLSRGRVDITVVRKELESPTYDVRFDENVFQAYWNAVQAAFKSAGLKSDAAKATAATNILNRREVIELVPQELDVADEKDQVLQAVSVAVNELVAMRETEGKRLATELRDYLASLSKLVGQIGTAIDGAPERFRERLQNRLKNLTGGMELDPERLAQEVALMADRTDISEEISRLGSHIEQFENVMDDAGAGKKLDFLLQEMLREVNTSGSKVQNSDAQAHVIDAKGVLEKMREQVQNVE